MKHIIWITVNGLFLLITTIYIWFFRSPETVLVGTGILLGQLAMILFLINVNMYFIFLVIKKSTKRNVKVTLAQLAKRMMKSHIPIAVAGTTMILIHASIMLVQLGPFFGFLHPKFISGYFAIFLLALTLIGGYRRYRKASGFRRKFHLSMALVFAVLFTIHLFLPL